MSNAKLWKARSGVYINPRKLHPFAILAEGTHGLDDSGFLLNHRSIKSLH